MPSLTFEPLISPALWTALAGLGLALLVWYARRRPQSVPRRRWWTIIVLTAVCAAAVLAILLNPTWIMPIKPPAGKPLLTVMVDQSASMAVADVSGHSRWAAAAEIATRLEPEFAARFDIEVRTFSEVAAAAAASELAGRTPDGLSTNIGGALSAALSTERPQGQAVYLIGDGAHNAPGGIAPLLDALRTARTMDAPVYTTTLGGESTLRDLEISVGRPQELAFVGQRVPIAVTVRQRGRLTDRTEVVLLENGRELARQARPIAPDAKASFSFSVVQNKAGLYRYDLRVDPHSEEATAANNSAASVLRVVDRPIRVLLLEGKPYWDAKFLIRTLAADPSLEVDAIVRIAGDRYLMRTLSLERGAEIVPSAGTARAEDGTEAGTLEEDAASPSARRAETSSIVHDPQSLLEGSDGLPKYQVVVLGRDAEAFLTPAVLDRLRTWISRDGGSLICYRGSPVAQASSDLARIMPVRWTPARESRFRVRLTDRGNESGWLSPGDIEEDVFSRLPSLATAAPAEKPHPLSVVLAKSADEPGPAVVAYESYGTGRVVAIEGSGMWRWAFLSPQYQKADRVYEWLWQSLLRWLVSSAGLVPGHNLALRTDKVSYAVGETVSAVLLSRDESGAKKAFDIELTDENSGSKRNVAAIALRDEPGVYRVPFGALPIGSYRAAVAGGARETPNDATTTVAFDVRPRSAEQLDVRARPDLMQRISEETGGVVLPPDKWGSLAREFRAHQAKSRPERVERQLAWDRWWVLAGVFVVWSITWGLRRFSGLV
jgi:hypothetical protein